MIVLVFILFISSYILARNLRNRNILFLGMVLVLFSLYAITHYAVNSADYNFLKTVLYNHLTPLYLLAGPCYLFFIKFTLSSKAKFKGRDVFHLLPFLIQLVAISAYIILPWDEKYRLVNSIYWKPTIQADIEVNLFFNSTFNHNFRLSHILLYIIWSISLVLKRRKYNANHYRKKTGTLLKLSLILLSIVLCYYIHVLLIVFKGTYHTNLIQIIIYIDIILLLLLIIQFAKFPELYLSDKKIKPSYLDASPFSKSKALKPEITIKADDEEKIRLRIEQLKKNKKFFVNPKNNFQNFSEHIKYPDHIIRHYLKAHNTSYNDLKNKVRIEVAKELLQETKLKYNLDYIAEKSGFNSRSNFYSIFKKYEKCTPRNYLDKI